MGHARALLALRRPSAQQALALRIESEGLSVRDVERLVAKARPAPPTQKHPPPHARAVHIRDIEDKARARLGTKVTLDYANGRGRLIIHLYSDDDLQRLLDVLSISP